MSAGHDSLLYARVETVLAGEITDGDLKIGDQLPTEDNLIARFGVSRITVRRAIQNLVSRGLVEIRRGKGTFVAAPKITHDLKELSGFVEDMHALGRKPTARVISKEIVTANATVARQLGREKKFGGDSFAIPAQAHVTTESRTDCSRLPGGIDEFPYSREMMIVVFGDKIQVVYESHRSLQTRVGNGSGK
jgi:DNA-binding transcriptional regulator YhcF (GntR family)